jgi:hypothetical protein
VNPSGLAGDVVAKHTRKKALAHKLGAYPMCFPIEVMASSYRPLDRGPAALRPCRLSSLLFCVAGVAFGYPYFRGSSGLRPHTLYIADAA